jgi:hypothetical protein
VRRADLGPRGTRGRVDLVLRVGAAVVAERKAEIAEGSVNFEVALPLKTWKASRRA